MLINRDQICAIIPHGESMCLLDQVVTVDDKKILCLSTHHLEDSNPLKGEKLGSWTLIEYGAQAAAVHKGMADSDQGAPANTAYIAQVKNIHITEPWVNASELQIEAVCLISDLSAAAYQINISDSNKLLLSGRITLSLG